MKRWQSHYLNWQGRICRKTYLIYSIPIGLIVIFAEEYCRSKNFYIYTALILSITYPALMLNIKRAHDLDKPGWYNILLLLPLICFIPMFEFTFEKGKDEPNRFGLPDNSWNKDKEN